MKLKSTDAKKSGDIAIRDRLYVGETVSFEFGGQQYRLAVDDVYRDKLWWRAHIDRAVIRLERVAAERSQQRSGN